jgi:hypothetical protein
LAEVLYSGVETLLNPGAGDLGEMKLKLQKITATYESDFENPYL